LLFHFHLFIELYLCLFQNEEKTENAAYFYNMRDKNRLQKEYSSKWPCWIPIITIRIQTQSTKQKQNLEQHGGTPTKAEMRSGDRCGNCCRILTLLTQRPSLPVDIYSKYVMHETMDTNRLLQCLPTICRWYQRLYYLNLIPNTFY
jgi:hypothetical protein